jgi:hypothetical protein
MTAATRSLTRRLAAHGAVAQARRAVQKAAAQLRPDQGADLRAVLSRPGGVGATGLTACAFVIDRDGIWVCPGVAVLLRRGELDWPSLLTAAGPLVKGQDRSLDPSRTDEAYQRLERLVAGCPSWDGALSALADELDWLAATAASVARELGAELDRGWACRVLADLLDRFPGGGWS